MKYRFGILCFFILIIGTYVVIQAKVSDVIVDADLRMLKIKGEMYGKDSEEYAVNLIGLSIEYEDTAYAKYRGDFARAILEIEPFLFRQYGPAHVYYRNAMVSLSSYYSLGRYYDDKFPEDSIKVGAVISKLEKYLNVAGENEEEYCAELSSYYRYKDKDKKRQRKYAKRRLMLAERHKDSDPLNYGYALLFYIESFDKPQEINSLIDESLASISDAYVLEIVSGQLWLSLRPDTSPTVWLKLMGVVSKCLHPEMIVPVKIYELAASDNVSLIRQLEVEMDSLPLPLRVEIYNTVSNQLKYFAKNPQEALRFRQKSIQVAVSANREDLLFYTIGEKERSYYESLAVDYDNLGETTAAIEAQKRAVDAYQIKFGKNSETTLDALRYLSSLYNGLAMFEQEIDCLWECYAICSALYGGDTKEGLGYKINIAGCYKEWNKYDKCIELCLDLLKSDNPEPARKAELYNLIGQCYDLSGDYDEAIASFKTAYDLDPKQQYLRNLAGIYKELSDESSAASIFQQIYAGFNLDKASDDEKYDYFSDFAGVHPSKALECFNKAEKYLSSASTRRRIEHYQRKAMAQGSAYAALQDLEKAVEIFNRENYNDSIQLAVLKRDMADYYSSVKDYLRADKLYVEALEIMQGLSPTDPRLTSLLNNAALNLSNMSQYGQAIRINKLLCKIRKETLGVRHPDYQTSLSNLFFNYIDSGQIDEARLLCDDIAPDMQDIYLAIVNFQKGEYQTALKGFQAFGKRNRQMKPKCDEYIRKIYRITASDKYVPLALKEMEDARHQIINEYIYLSENQRKAQSFYTGNIMNAVMNDVELGDEMVTAACDFNIFRKGLLFHTGQEISRILSSVSGGNEMLEQIQSLRGELTSFIAQGDSSNVVRITEIIDKKERDMTVRYVAFDELKRGLDLSTKHALKGLPKNSVAIDFIRYEAQDTVKYGAFVISPQNKRPLFLQLFTESDLRNFAVKNGGIDGKFYRNVSDKGAGYRFVWEKLEPYMEGAGKVYFSADGMLNRIAIEFLTDAADIPASDKYHLHRVFHLADIRPDVGLGNQFTAVGVSDYNTPPAVESAKFRSEERGSWASLPNVATEIESITSILSSNAPEVSQRTFLNNQASERMIKDLNGNSVSVFHIATHGFYKSEEQLKYAFENQNSFDHNVACRTFAAGESSLSGLILRTGNLTWNSLTINSDDDDVLTNKEIENLHFPNLNLTVLSACESGLGDNDTEGVWGLQRAFRIAGTKAMVCSLRKVDDRCTAEFMKEFYTLLSEGSTIYSAFHSARNLIYQSYKRKPEYWAAFILIE